MTQFEVVEKGLEKEVLRDYLITFNGSAVARKHNLNVFNTLRYIAWVKQNKPKLFEQVESKLAVDVFRGFEKVIEKLDRKVDSLEDNVLEQDFWLAVVREYKGAMKDYADIVEKVKKFNEDNDLRKALFEVLDECDPELGAKVMGKIKELRDKRQVLKLN